MKWPEATRSGSTRSWRQPIQKTGVAKAVNLFMLVLVVFNVAAVVLETVESIYLSHRDLFHYFADISVVIFTIEYILRIWSCDVEPGIQAVLSLGGFALL